MHDRRILKSTMNQTLHSTDSEDTNLRPASDSQLGMYGLFVAEVYAWFVVGAHKIPHCA